MAVAFGVHYLNRSPGEKSQDPASIGCERSVMKASTLGTDIWIENSITVPRLNDPINRGEVVPSHKEFDISIYGRFPHAHERSNDAYRLVSSTLLRWGYKIYNDDRHCQK